MKKSTYVPASLIVALAATVSTTGCSSQRCVDAMGRTIPDQSCRDGSVVGAHWVRSGGFGSGSSRHYSSSSTGGGFFGG